MRWLIALAAMLALAVGGCGSSGDDDGGGEESAASTTASDGAATTAEASAPQCSGDEVSLQLSFFPNAQHTGYLVAANRGYYDDLGVKVRTIPGGPTVNPSLQVAQGNVDMAMMDFSEALNAKANGADILWVAQTYQSDPLRYITIRRDPPLPDPAALRGLKVGTQQVGELEAELNGMLQQNGLSIDDVRIVSITPGIQDLLSRKVDVFPLQTFFHVAQLEEAGIRYPDAVDVLDPNRLGTAVAAGGVAVNRAFYEDHRDAVACVLAAAERGWQTAIDDPRGVVADVDKMQEKGLASPEANAINVQQTIDLVTRKADGTPADPLSLDMAYFEESQRRLLDAGLIREEVDLGELVDPEPLERARALLGGA